MDTPTIEKVITILRREVKHYNAPIVTLVAQTHHDPFRVLIATLLSLRTKDDVTANACARLFPIADTPQRLVSLPQKKIEELIYPVGFYRVKSKNILLICKKLIEEYEGRVPDEIDELLQFPGVGRKTANLVVSEGYNKPAMCVDVHVNRISYRLGYVKTKTPHDTEMALRKKLPLEYWNDYNYLLVAHGQHICVPISPWCSKCPVARYCERRGVTRSR